MSAARDLLLELREAGVQLVPRGDRMGIEAPKGVVTAALRARVARHKPELLALLAANDASDTRGRLDQLASELCQRQSLIDALGSVDLVACEGLSEAALKEFIRSLERARRIAACERPPEYVQPVLCAGCGPVWLWEGAPLEVATCPWCRQRSAGRVIPRPPVACQACRHFERDPINPQAGIGTCKAGAAQRAPLYPALRRSCAGWKRLPCREATHTQTQGHDDA